MASFIIGRISLSPTNNFNEKDFIISWKGFEYLLVLMENFSRFYVLKLRFSLYFHCTETKLKLVLL